ncbi:transglutaminase-like putative cysteine protease [Natronocella acetinitrilica]|uniref:Transglutaminase-like putative cysteine protease n=1 Tax=Natronocella acetinitrilica TaxID=414046 RepID=A0AAE3G3R9_9GAMM|nr:transglutaminase family protein [Natronocella acetinitrilica]MCP1675250.1 transglutaminase-like putative cysteine protease [Natronocella acetinitrilica]
MHTPDHRWLRVGCRLEMTYAVASPMILLLRPRSGLYQWVAGDTYRVLPNLPIAEYTDVYGNLCQRLLAPVGPLSIWVQSEVRVLAGAQPAPGAPFVPVEELPAETLIHLTPSRYCEADRLGPLANEITAGALPGYDQVTAISRWINQRIDYLSESDPEPVSATEMVRRGNGVCRDFAHLGIALCRSLSIPARLVVGYLERLEPMDLHAWFEAYVGGNWHTFDPTRPDLTGGRVCLGYGRDAADVAVFSQFGPPVIPSRLEVYVEPIDAPTA